MAQKNNTSDTRKVSFETLDKSTTQRSANTDRQMCPDNQAQLQAKKSSGSFKSIGSAMANMKKKRKNQQSQKKSQSNLEMLCCIRKSNQEKSTLSRRSTCCSANRDQRQQYLDQLHKDEIEVSFDNHEAEPAEPEKRNRTEDKYQIIQMRNANLIVDNTEAKKFISCDEINKKALEQDRYRSKDISGAQYQVVSASSQLQSDERQMTHRNTIDLKKSNNSNHQSYNNDQKLGITLYQSLDVSDKENQDQNQFTVRQTDSVERHSNLLDN